VLPQYRGGWRVEDERLWGDHRLVAEVTDP
jgi:hypothetical protein